MKKLGLLVLGVTLFFSVGEIFSVEGKEAEPFKPGEPVTEPTTPEEAGRLEERVDRSEEEVTEAERRITDNEPKKDDPTLSTEQRATIERQLGEDKQLVETFNSAKGMLDKSEVQRLLQQYKEQLAQLTEKPLTPEDFQTSFQEATAGRDATEIDSLRDWVDTGFDFESMKGKVDKAALPEDKLAAIDEMRSQMQQIKDLVEKELARAEKEGVSDEYKASLDRLNDSLAQTREDLDGLSLGVDEQRIGFFTRLARGIRSWFDRTFDFHKESVLRRSVKDELDLIQKEKKALKPVVRLFSDVEEYERNVNGLTNVIDNMVEVGVMDSQQRYDSMEQHAQKLFDTIDTFKKQFTPEQEGAINDAYTRLQELIGVLLAKSKRYRGESPTLFDSEFAAYTGELKGSEFQANQMYETLGITPGDTPEKITAEQIDQAYEEIGRTMEGTPQAQAARNASVILRDSVGKVTYDAFLKDWQKLQDMKIDPTEPKTNEIVNYLNSKGELSKLEISKDLYDRIFNEALPTLGETMTEVGMQRHEYTSLFKQLGEYRTNLQESFSRAKSTSPQAPAGPPG